MSMQVVLIAAVSANGVIGNNGGMPWGKPVDGAHFKRTTSGHPVIMGRRTFEGIIQTLGKPLPGRTTIVLSRSGPSVPEGVIVARSIGAALGCARATGRETVFVAGGGSVYEQFIDRADAMVLTELHDSYDGNVRFPDWEHSEWRERRREPHDNFDIVEYTRTSSSRYRPAPRSGAAADAQ